MSYTFKGSDWYFYDLSDDMPDEQRPQFAIVHKRYWHRHHCLFDCLPSDLIDLPRTAETMESCFEYYGGDWSKLIQMLTGLGLEQINPNTGAKHLVHNVLIGDQPRMIELVCDTKPIYDVVAKQVQSQKKYGHSFADYPAYLAWLQELVPGTGCDLYGQVAMVATVAIMDKAIAESLPEYPEGISD